MGSGPYCKRIPRKLTCWILRYGIMVKKNQGIFLNFPIIFQFSLYAHFMSPTRGSQNGQIFFILFKISSPQKISKYAKTSSCSEWSVNIIKRIYFVESAKPQNHPTIPDMPQTKSNRLLTLPTRYPRLLHTIHDFYTLSTTSKHYPRLLHTTHDSYTLFTTSTHYPQLLHTTYDFHTLPTT